jgi:hypothetical protein
LNDRSFLSLPMLAIVGTTTAAFGAIDYQALADEARSLRDDPDVVRYLSRDVREAHRLSTLEENIKRSLALVQQYRQQAEESRRRQRIGMTGMVAGDTPLGRQAQQIGASAGDPAAFEAKASEYSQAATDELVELVSRYRDIKARAVAQKERGKPTARSKSAAQPKQVGGCLKDTDCKGDRICEQGLCVSPKQAIRPP